MGLLDGLKQVGINVPTPSGDAAKRAAGNEAGKAVTGVLGGVFGKIKDGIKDGAEVATNVAKVTGVKTVLNTQYPENIPLTQSKGMNQFVENGLSALDLFKGRPDGKPGADTLAGINTLREKEGLPPHADVNQVTRDDVGLIAERLARQGTPHAQSVLNTAMDTLGGLKKDYPKPEAPTAAPPTQRADPSLGG